MKKERIDILLVERGLADSREKAKKIIMAGVVLVDNERVDKPGTKVEIEKDIRIKGTPLKYVGRGGLKLEKAITEFSLDLNGKVALDIGASTGGFSDCMLQNGIKKVYAIDVGYGQLDWKIRSDPKVVTMDRTNIRHVTIEDIGELADFITIDVSFISLKLVLPVVKELLAEDGKVVALIKPQFEAGKENVGKKGVVKDKKVHREVIKSIYEHSKQLGLYFKDITYSPVKGAEGNIEYLAYLDKHNEDCIDIESILEKVVESSHEKL
jgi:23S rRNA (cytidine1920-2'-O)/16S rRNA (cytidine1409-2'-O)-methyltransferase